MKKWLQDQFNQTWTFVSMFAMWFVMEGSAKKVLGWLILGATFLWFVTVGIRNGDDE